jgi:hypothetical protein
MEPKLSFTCSVYQTYVHLYTTYCLVLQLPLEPCEKDTDCCGNQECRTYSGLGPLGDHAGYPDMTAIGKKRCVPRSWIHASPQSNDVMYAEGKNSSIWSLNLKPPMGWTCNDGTTRDWCVCGGSATAMPHVTCAG